MTEPEYDAYRRRAVPGYAADLERARGMSPEDALRRSAETFADTLGEAAAPERTWVLRVLDADGAAVGWLWVGPHPHRGDGVFVYEIEIDEAHQGRGLGRATMLAAEELARAAGLRHIALNVFGWNSRAEGLYRSLGYDTESTQLGKPLLEEVARHRVLAAVEARADLLLSRLPSALDGTGPALLPLPDGPGRAEVLAALRPDEPLERDDVALVVPTAGSTGTPKGALLTASALLHSARATLDRLGGPGQWLLAMPVTHVAGLQVLVRSLVGGVPPVTLDLSAGFTADAFAAATARLDPGGRRYTALVPTALRRLLDAGVDLSAYDAILVGGAALSFAVPPNVVRTYGMSETCGGCVYDGRPLAGVDVVIGAGGRISIGGPVVFAGYRLRPDLTAEALVDGRHVTQDVGAWAKDGRLDVIGRVDDVLVSGGVNVPAALVEAVVARHPAVRAVAVVGTPDDEWGERVVAVVQANPGAAAPDLSQLRAFCTDALEPAALPRQVVLVDQLPMLDSGKPDRSAVRNLVAAHRTR